MYIQECSEIINNNPHIAQDTLYEAVVGSRALGCSTQSSDYDVINIFMPTQEFLYPQNYGYINGFDRQDEISIREITFTYKNNAVDLCCCSLCEFFIQAGIKCTPYMIEGLFVEDKYITTITDIGAELRKNSSLFLSQKIYQSNMKYISELKQQLRINYLQGYEAKTAYKILRLMDILYQILDEGAVELSLNKEEYLQIKKEGLSLSDFNKRYDDRKISVEKLLGSSSLKKEPSINNLRSLLYKMIIEYYNL